MKHSTAVLLSLATVLVLSAVTASSAMAFTGWKVEGAFLGTGETRAIAEATTVTESFFLKGDGLEISCETLKISGGIIEGKVSSAVTSLEYSKCTTPAAHCKVETPIKTKAMKAEVKAGAGNEDTMLFEPQTGTEVASIKLLSTGGTCPVAGKYTVTGTILTKAPKGKLEEAVQVLEVNEPEATSKVKINGKLTEFKGKAGLQLTSGLKWSAQ